MRSWRVVIVESYPDGFVWRNAGEVAVPARTARAALRKTALEFDPDMIAEHGPVRRVDVSVHPYESAG